MALVDPDRHLCSDHHVHWMDSFYSDYKSKSSSLYVDLMPLSILFSSSIIQLCSILDAVTIIYDGVISLSHRLAGSDCWHARSLLGSPPMSLGPIFAPWSMILILLLDCSLNCWYMHILKKKKFRLRNTYHLVDYSRLSFVWKPSVTTEFRHVSMFSGLRITIVQ